MVVDVVEVRDKYLLVEYVDKKGVPQRKLVAKEYYPMVSKKGSIEMREYLVRRAIDYSDVDLMLTLESSNPLLISEITKNLRYEGIWTREDARANPNTVLLVVKRLARTFTEIKPNTVLQAILKVPDANKSGVI